MPSGTHQDASAKENMTQTEGRDAAGERYDFQRLERSIEFLLEEHARLGAEREALLAELADREHRVAQLEAEVVDERRRRAVAVEGVDKILSRLEQLQSSVAMPNNKHAESSARRGAPGATQ